MQEDGIATGHLQQGLFFAVATEICPFSFVIGGSASGVVVDCIFEMNYNSNGCQLLCTCAN